MTTTDTPRPDNCPHCGSNTEVDIFFRTNCGNLLDYREGNHGKIAGQRTELCLKREARQKAEAEIERLNKQLSITEAELADAREWLDERYKAISEAEERAEKAVERLRTALQSCYWATNT